jgi:hypothetical protein
LRIEAMISYSTKEQRDEKVVAFDVSPDGKINYDFSGYVGDTCISEAKRIFDALREKGIFIVDDRAVDELLQTSTENITANLLQQERLHPHIVKNKSQAELADSLRRVLEKMEYPQVHQNSIGGAIELEAFKGPIGYRVILPPDGSAQVLKNASQKDVSNDLQDPVTREAQLTGQQEAQKREQEAQRRAQEVQKRAQEKKRLAGSSIPKRQLLQN